MNNFDGRPSLRTPRHTGRPSLFERQSLFTGTGRQSLFGNARQSLRASDAQGLGRLSCGISKPRPSHVGKKAPPRNPRDKEYQAEQRAKVRAFLQTNGAKFDAACLKGPNASQFNALFTFIYVYLDPDFDLINAKEQVPKILNGLGYPIPIKASMMQLYGTNAWPHLLDGLAFMIELIQEFDKPDVLQSIFGESTDVQNNRLFAYSYCTKAFQKCIRTKCDASESNLEEERESFRSQIFNGYGITNGETQADRRLADLNRQVEQLRMSSKKEIRENLEQSVRTTKDDIVKLHEHNAKMEQYLAVVSQEEADAKQTISKLTSDIESLKAEITEKKTLIRNQPISAQEARESTQRLQNLRNELKLARNELHEIRNKPDNNAAIYQLFSDIKAKFAEMGLEITTVAENYFTPDELTRYGFTSLGEDRNMDADTARACLEEFDEAVKKLVARMKIAEEEARTQESRNKAVTIECDRRLDRGCLEKANIQQDADQVRHGLLQAINERDKELARAELKQNVVVERFKAAEARKKKFEAKLFKIDEEIMAAEVDQLKRKAQLEDKLNAEGERIVEHVSQLFEEYQDIQNKITQKGEELDMIIAAHYRRLGMEKPIESS